MKHFYKQLFFFFILSSSFACTLKTASIDAWTCVQAMQQSAANITKENLKIILEYIQPRINLIDSNPTVFAIDQCIRKNIPAIVTIITDNPSDFYSFMSFLMPQYHAIENATAVQLAQKIDQIEPKVVKGLMSYINDPESLDTLAQATIKSIANVDISIIETISWKNNAYIELFAPAAFSCTDTSIVTINRILELAQQNNVPIPALFSFEALKKRVNDFFAQHNIQLSAITLIMLVMYKHFVGTLPPQLPTITPTEQHAITNANTLASSPVFALYSTNKQRMALIDNILAKENELNQQGYYTFIHGQKWQFHLIEHWYTRLWEIKNSCTATDFLFVHCKKPCTDTNELENARQLRYQILQQGEIGNGIRDKILFLNYAFFGNDGRLGSNSADYLISNSSALRINIHLKEIFAMLGYEKFYARYRKELYALEKEHKALSTYGHLVLIAVPKNKINDYVYLSGSKGVMEYSSINGQRTNDIALIMEALTHNPEKLSNSDVIQFCLVLTDDVLTPASELKMYSYNLADQAALAAWQKKSDDLFNRIAKDIVKTF